MSTTIAAPTERDYARIFEAECRQTYPAVEAFERECGVSLNRYRLEPAARVLACPFKAHAPNWQHGRVLYALVSRYLGGCADPHVALLDVGTAKGFSALCLLWALADAGREGSVTSVDVLDPDARVRRNTVAEVDGYKSLAEILSPWPEAQDIRFIKGTGVQAIQEFTRIHVAYLDGKHTFDAVSDEIALLAKRQQPGDLIVWDDAQIDGVARAIAGATAYAVRYLDVLPHRRYAMGTRRG